MIMIHIFYPICQRLLEDIKNLLKEQAVYLILDYRPAYLKCCVNYVANGRQASVQYLLID